MTHDPPIADRPAADDPPTVTSIGLSDSEASGFAALFRAEFATMFRLAHLLGAADPEDVAQEAFARLHARWRSLADNAAAGGYLRTTVLNLVRSAARRRSVEIRHRAIRTPEELSESAESAALQSVSDSELLAALGVLSQRHREALILRFWLDASERQIADAMGTSIGTAKSHVSRGLKALRVAILDGGEI